MTAKEYYKLTRLVETRNWTLEMIFNFAEEYSEIINKKKVEIICQHNWIKSHSKHMLYCGDCGKYKPEGT